MTTLAMNPSPQRSATRVTPAVWEEVRNTFHRSLLIDTPLASLAQNIEGCAWALPDPEEKPAAYIELLHAEVLERLRSRGLSPARFDDLVEILKGTLEFDRSLGAMLPAAAAANAAGSLGEAVGRNLARLAIPADFPLGLCAFAPGTKNFCREEGICTLEDFLIFARRASRAVIVGGEFRDVLNAISHIDEVTLARYLPFRPKSSGLHVVEAFALLVRPMDLEQRILLARQGGVIPEELRPRLAETCAYFDEQLHQLRARHEQGAPLSRLVVSLDDLSLESAVCALLGALLQPGSPSPAAPMRKPAPAAAFTLAGTHVRVPIARRLITSLWPWK
jgi:hypothetical protein